MVPIMTFDIYVSLADSYTSNMSLKQRIRESGLELGFDGVGFSGLEPMQSYIDEVESRPPEMYGWAKAGLFSIIRGASPAEKHKWARSMVVLIRSYYRKQFPEELEGLYGRAYLMDERKVPAETAARLIEFLAFLQKEGVSSSCDGEIPMRMAAAQAGLVNYGKNCFAFANNAIKGSSWLEIVPLVLNVELEPDEPSIEEKCPPKCKNRCMKACPTGAIYAEMKMNPLRCIAYNTYYGADITPMDLRQAMGTWLYGCDVCQQACPRNMPWMRKEKPFNEELDSRKADYKPETLLRMDSAFYETTIWPRFFYISRKRLDRWQMNAARAMGNIANPDHIPLLKESLETSAFENVRAMSAWALGRIGGPRVRQALETNRGKESGVVLQEIELALANA
jgi:epoxyqueuosine reductase